MEDWRTLFGPRPRFDLPEFVTPVKAVGNELRDADDNPFATAEGNDIADYLVKLINADNPEPVAVEVSTDNGAAEVKYDYWHGGNEVFYRIPAGSLQPVEMAGVYDSVWEPTIWWYRGILNSERVRCSRDYLPEALR